MSLRHKFDENIASYCSPKQRSAFVCFANLFVCTVYLNVTFSDAFIMLDKVSASSVFCDGVTGI